MDADDAPKAPLNDVTAEGDFPLAESLKTEKSAILSSPSENRLVSVILYHPVVVDFEDVAATNGLSNVDVLGSLIQDLNQAAAAAVVVSVLALKSIFGSSSGVPGVSHVVVSSVLDSSSSSLEAVRSEIHVLT